MSRFCTKCGRELTEGMRFCPGCGSPLMAIPEESPVSLAVDKVDNAVDETAASNVVEEAPKAIVEAVAEETTEVIAEEMATPVAEEAAEEMATSVAEEATEEIASPAAEETATPAVGETTEVTAEETASPVAEEALEETSEVAAEEMASPAAEETVEETLDETAEVTAEEIATPVTENATGGEQADSKMTPARGKKESMALSIWAFILGLLSMLCCCYLGIFGCIVALVSIILSFVALAKNKRGKALAIVALICGIIGMGLSIYMVMASYISMPIPKGLLTINGKSVTGTDDLVDIIAELVASN